MSIMYNLYTGVVTRYSVQLCPWWLITSWGLPGLYEGRKSAMMTFYLEALMWINWFFLIWHQRFRLGSIILLFLLLSLKFSLTAASLASEHLLTGSHYLFVLTETSCEQKCQSVLTHEMKCLNVNEYVAIKRKRGGCRRTECWLWSFSSKVPSVALGKWLSSFIRARRPSFYGNTERSSPSLVHHDWFHHHLSCDYPHHCLLHTCSCSS